MESEAVGHLRALIAKDPWTGNYDHDWCHHCYAEQDDYGPKPWTGHETDCVWLRASEWLQRHDETKKTT